MNNSEEKSNNVPILAIAKEWDGECAFEPSEDHNALFIIRESNTIINRLHGTIELRNYKNDFDSILHLGVLLDYIFIIDNKDGITWKNAKSIACTEPGLVVNLNSNRWIISRKIKVTLSDCPDNKKEEIIEAKTEDTNRVTVKENEGSKSEEEGKSMLFEDKKLLSPDLLIENNNCIVKPVNQQDITDEDNIHKTIEEKISERKSNEEVIREPKIVSSNMPEVHPNLDFNDLQYLKAGRDPMNFFFEGSSVDKRGAYFEVKFNQDDKEYGQLSIITSIENIKTIDEGFRKKAIKIVDSDVILRESKGFSVIENGELLYNPNDKVWFIKSPVKIKLYK